ncbi:MAG: YIP1 family protein [candidate division Zixibacteria bacterium]|nr:YIP1 family protein [candidate division Zixibacteria bacterium]
MDQVDITQTPSPNEKGGLSFRGLIEVFYQPTSFFEELKDSPKVLVPYLALAVVCGLFFYLATDFIVAMQMELPEVQEAMEAQRIPLEQMKTIMWYQTGIGGIIALLLAPLLIAGLGLFWNNFVFGLKSSFKQVLSLVLYGEFLYMIGAMVHVPIMFAKDTIMVTFSPAVLVADQGMTSIWFVLLDKFSVFHIWEIVVVGIGLSVLCEVPRNKGYLLAVLSVGGLSVLHVITTGIGMLFR